MNLVQNKPDIFEIFVGTSVGTFETIEGGPWPIL